jgi:hypothetical protein
VVLFLFPLIFLTVLINARYFTDPRKRTIILALLLIPLGWLYLSLVSDRDTPVNVLPAELDLFDIPGGILVVFVSVVFVNAPHGLPDRLGASRWTSRPAITSPAAQTPRRRPLVHHAVGDPAQCPAAR